MMIFREFLIKRCAGFALLLLFCLFYRFIIEGNYSYNEFYGITDTTVNTSGYLVYIHTATFYTAFFVFIFGKNLIKADNQILIRSSRKSVFLKNAANSLFCSITFSVCFCLPHLIYMQFCYTREELLLINFYKLILIQILSYTLYYMITSCTLLLLYYMTRNCVLSQLIAISINMLLMFGYRLLHIKSPIESTLVYTKYFTGLSEYKIISGMLPLPIIILIMSVSSYLIFSWKDVL